MYRNKREITMKHISFGALCAVLMFNTNAFATPISHLHADGVTMNNIAVMQHSIMLNAFNNFDGSMAGIIDRHAQKPAKSEPVEECRCSELSVGRKPQCRLQAESRDGLFCL